MKIGVLVQNFAGFPETHRSARACIDFAMHAEQAGFDSVWVTDHIVLPRERQALYPHNDSGTFPYSWLQDIHDPLVLIGALAQATERVEIGVAVLVIPYRHPLTTAKMLATADQLAEGRVILGAGVGWLRDEFEALGLSAEVFEHRGSVTEDYLRAMREAWTADGAASYDGPYVRFRDVGTYPRPARSPHIPVWVGGKGDRALRRAVRLGDGYLAISADPMVLRAEVSRLHALADEAGRDPAELTVALIDGIVVTPAPLGADRSPLHGTAEQIVEGIGAFADAGLGHLVAGVRWAGDGSFAASVGALDIVAADVLPYVSGD
ncbi:MAG: LLM class F420-dependent oxidoreductase [Acidimicrobiales bacterium]